MQISAINKFQQPQFKSTIPVYHWTRELGGSFRPVDDKIVTQKLQEKLVNFFNRPYNPNHCRVVKKAVNMLKEQDIYYKTMIDYNNKSGKKETLTRSFYNTKGGWNYNFTYFKPISYLITGCDVNYFNDNFAKDIGRAKAVEKELKDEPASADLKMARHNYYVNGLNFVNDKKHQIRDSEGITYAIHTKFDVVRNKDGEVEDYNFVDLKLLPEKGPENPFVKLSTR